MTTEAQRLADELVNTPFESTRHEAAALLRRQEAALMQAREVLENSCIRWADVDEAINAINQLLGEPT